jgi:hypothetical protein
MTALGLSQTAANGLGMYRWVWWDVYILAKVLKWLDGRWLRFAIWFRMPPLVLKSAAEGAMRRMDDEKTRAHARDGFCVADGRGTYLLGGTGTEWMCRGEEEGRWLSE